MTFILLWIISGIITELIALLLLARNGGELNFMELFESTVGAVILGMIGLGVVVAIIGYTLFLENRGKKDEC